MRSKVLVGLMLVGAGYSLRGASRKPAHRWTCMSLYLLAALSAGSLARAPESSERRMLPHPKPQRPSRQAKRTILELPLEEIA